MHILLIHQAFASLGEPGGTRHHELARYLVQRGHRLTVIAGQVNYLTGEARGRAGWVETEVDDLGVRILRCRATPGWHRSFFLRALSFITFTTTSFVVGLGVREVDLVWGTSPPLLQGLTAWALARLKRAVFLFEVRDLWPAFAVAAGVLRRPLLIRLTESVERTLYRHADRVVANSPGFVDHLRSRGARAVEVVPNGVDLGMFDPEAGGDGFRRVHRLEGAYVVLYAGAHGLSNDLDVVLEAADRLRAREAIVFVLLGDGKEKSRLEARAKEAGLTNVRFLPAVPKLEMPSALAAADACLAILKPLDAYKTVYPNKVFDYMAAGRPVILAIDGVIRALVEEAGAGVFVPPGDPEALAGAVEALVDEPERGRAMGRAGRKCVEAGFDRARLAEDLARIMEGLAPPKAMDPVHGARTMDDDRH